MKKLTILLLFTFISVLTVQGQDQFFRWYEKGDSFYDQGEFEKAKKWYEQAIAADVSDRFKGYLRFKLARTYSAVGRTDKSFELLFSLVNPAAPTKYIYQLDQEVLMDDTLLSPLKKHEMWDSLMNTVEIFQLDINKDVDNNLVQLVEEMRERDEKYRLNILSVREEFGNNSPEMATLTDSMLYNDSINIHLADSIIQEHGWPGIDLLGFHSHFSFFLIAQHAKLEYQEKYLPLLREKVQQGKVLPGILMMLEDRVSLRNNGYQLYGSQYCRDLETDEYYFCPILDPEFLNHRRHVIGLGTFEKELEHSGEEWDWKAYEKQLPKYMEIYQRDKPREY